MSSITVREYLKKYDMDKRIIELTSSSATVFDAANSLGCKEEEIAKTLSFRLKDRFIVIVTSGTKKIDNSKYKAEFLEKAHMLSFEEVEDVTTHPVGGVCPFALPGNVEVYLDTSLKEFNYVYPACGGRNNAIKVSIDELEKTTNYKKWIDVCK